MKGYKRTSTAEVRYATINGNQWRFRRHWTSGGPVVTASMWVKGHESRGGGPFWRMEHLWMEGR